MLEDVFDDIGLVDERDDVQGSVAVGAFEGIDLVDFLNQSGPVGLASVGGSLSW